MDVYQVAQSYQRFNVDIPPSSWLPFILRLNVEHLDGHALYLGGGLLNGGRKVTQRVYPGLGLNFVWSSFDFFFSLIMGPMRRFSGICSPLLAYVSSTLQ